MTQEKEIAANILKRAWQLETKKRLTEALTCYQEGIEILLNALKNLPSNNERNVMRGRIEEYMGRAESVKKRIEEEKKLGLYHEQIIIEENSSGHSYEKVFGRFFDQEVTIIEIDDPYIRLFHQCQNFLRLCELAVKNCDNLKEIVLTTGEDSAEQKKWLGMIQDDLAKRFNIKLTILFSSTLHDREIRLNNGWYIKSGRGLDYFKGPENKFCIGTNDMDLRKCHETTVDIIHKKDIRKTLG